LILQAKGFACVTAFRSFQILFKSVRRTAAMSTLAASLCGCHPLPTAQFDSTGDPAAADKPLARDRSSAAESVSRRASSTSSLAALDSPDPAVRRDALMKLADPQAAPLPTNMGRYAADPDRTVRQAAITAIAARRHPGALDMLRRGLADQDFDVRLASVAGLEMLNDPEATAELKRLASHTSELIREAAIRALIDLDDRDAVTQAAADKSWRVRRLAAEALARDSSFRGKALAEKLVRDGNPDVARQTIESVARWPLEQAGPILLTAMAGMPYTPRKLAARQLAERWPPAAGFEVDASTERRAKLLADLDRQWHAEFPAATRQLTTAQVAPRRSAESEAQSTKFDQRALAAVERFAAADVRDRRRAADSLRDGFASRLLPDPALARLSELMIGEPDGLVWVSVFDLLAEDAREPAMRLAYAALGHPVPEVRRRACDYLAAHPDSRHGPLLLASLDDRSPDVVAAAVKAISLLDSLENRRRLERLLNCADHQLRVEVAAALAHLGADSGNAALERLAFDPDPKVRRAAAVAMGEVPDKSFLPDLIRLLDDRPEIRRAALTSLPRVVGEDAGRSASASEPPGNPVALSPSTADESQRWKEWFRDRRARNVE
jgi:HEAT repeat protein